MGLTKSERELIILFQTGDRQAFEELYDQYAGMLFGVIGRLVPDPVLARHILEESFIYLWQNRASYDPDRERFFTWMNKCALEIAVAVAPKAEAGTQEALKENQGAGVFVDTKNNNR